MSKGISPESRERVLDAAEDLFVERGLTSVTLRDISERLKLNHASLYHHVPGGKESLYVEVMQRGLQKHHDGLNAVIAAAGDDWKTQLHAAAHWLVSHTPIDITRLRTSDLPALSKKNAGQLNRDMYVLLINPIEQVFANAVGAGDAARVMLLVGMFLFMLEGVHSAPKTGNPLTPIQMADQMIDVMVYGLTNTVNLSSKSAKKNIKHANQN